MGIELSKVLAGAGPRVGWISARRRKKVFRAMRGAPRRLETNLGFPWVNGRKREAAIGCASILLFDRRPCLIGRSRNAAPPILARALTVQVSTVRQI
jgi:hypothetical protein